MERADLGCCRDRLARVGIGGARMGGVGAAFAVEVDLAMRPPGGSPGGGLSGPSCAYGLKLLSKPMLRSACSQPRNDRSTRAGNRPPVRRADDKGVPLLRVDDLDQGDALPELHVDNHVTNVGASPLSFVGASPLRSVGANWLRSNLATHCRCNHPSLSVQAGFAVSVQSPWIVRAVSAERWREWRGWGRRR